MRRAALLLGLLGCVNNSQPSPVDAGWADTEPSLDAAPPADTTLEHDGEGLDPTDAAATDADGTDAPTDALGSDALGSDALGSDALGYDMLEPDVDSEVADAGQGDVTDDAAPDAGDAQPPADTTDGPSCPKNAALPVEGGLSVAASLPAGATCTWTLTLDAPRVLALSTAPQITLAGVVQDQPGASLPRVYAAGPLELSLSAPTDLGAPLEVTLWVQDLGAPPGPVAREHSLVWTDPPLVEVCDLACLMAAIAPDGHGGALLHDWFVRFSTTAHSERLGPALMLEDYADALGPDPETWDLTALPFEVTAVHNRFDLHNSAHCGELRVSLASLDPLYKPFHLIFLFGMPPGPDDLSPDGTLHCTGTALWWARLSELPEAQRVAAATARALATFTAQNFLAAETLEFLVAPWEWRQWFMTGAGASVQLDNRPLFQTVDIPRLNTAGAVRDAFLEFAGANAQALRERRVLIPEAFRAQSARVNQGVPWVPLDLTGLPAEAGDPVSLRRAIEQVGCPGCHTADAPFVQTDEQRQFSPFYDKELDARASLLQASAIGPAGPLPFAPLQVDFLAHP